MSNSFEMEIETLNNFQLNSLSHNLLLSLPIAKVADFTTNLSNTLSKKLYILRSSNRLLSRVHELSLFCLSLNFSVTDRK